jgi:hypothetical protein
VPSSTALIAGKGREVNAGVRGNREIDDGLSRVLRESLGRLVEHDAARGSFGEIAEILLQ